MMNRFTQFGLLSAVLVGGLAAGCADDEPDVASEEVSTDSQEWGWGNGGKYGPYGNKKRTKNEGSHNLFLRRDSLVFAPLPAVFDAENGRRKFGVAADLQTEDSSEALFEGFSALSAPGKQIVSNGRSCFTCHRGTDVSFGMPPPPLSDTIPLTDPLFTGLDADAQGDPDGMHNLDNHALFKYRPNRFNYNMSQSDPLRRVFFWRRSPQLTNVSLQHGFLNDGRASVMFDVVRGAQQVHTQEEDDPFEDVILLQDSLDIHGFVFGDFLLSDPLLAALRDPDDPMHEVLKNDPFYTVDLQTKAQKKGAKVFEKKCMGCHNTPNVFNNIDTVQAEAAGIVPGAPAVGPGQTGRHMNIGVSEANMNNLRFTEPDGTTIVVTLARGDGALVSVPVTKDIGLAASTRRHEDIGRFKVPQLRNISDYAPYFHDNSAATLEEAVDFHTSSHFRDSPDGKPFKFHLTPKQRADLLEFLYIL